MTLLSKERRWWGWLSWNQVGWRLESGGKGGVGGGTNQQPCAKSDTPTHPPQGMDTCDRPREDGLGALQLPWLQKSCLEECAQCSWKAGGMGNGRWSEECTLGGVEICTPRLGECALGEEC